MERHASCSAWDEDHETDDVMAEVLTRSASAAQREAREPLPPPSSQTSQPETRAPRPEADSRARVCAPPAGRPASSGYATDRILVLREQLRRLEVELASAHQGLRQAYRELDDADRAWRRQLRKNRTRRDRRGELWLQAGDAIDHE
jgi:hypothetical protein